MPKARRGLFRKRRGGPWYRYVWENGRLVQRSTGTSVYAEVCIIFERERAGEVVETPKRVPTFGRFESVYLEGLRANQRRPRTVETAEGSLRNLRRVFGPMKLNQISVADVERYKRLRHGEGVSPYTTLIVN